jgi:hypothetical protein
MDGSEEDTKKLKELLYRYLKFSAWLPGWEGIAKPTEDPW